METRRFARYAWWVLGANLAVIVWGALVRASGSGAGCGNHWPLCGAAFSAHPMAATLIEFAHRMSSGVVVILVLGLALWARRTLPRGHAARRSAMWALIFILSEALLGASLVLLGHVALDASPARVVWLSLHLVNTFFLLAALSLTAWWACDHARPELGGRRREGWLLGVGLVGTLLLGVSGAITALADTLFPAATLAQGMQQDFSPTAHFLVRLRVIHPALAVLFGVYLMLAAVYCAQRNNRSARHLAAMLLGLIVLQWTAGGLNIVLDAPVWLQLVHLLGADLVWITLVLLTAAVAEARAAATRIEPAPSHPPPKNA
ncbi:MAG: COX15/CtaA family protein [Terriglobales bacterium]